MRRQPGWSNRRVRWLAALLIAAGAGALALAFSQPSQAGPVGTYFAAASPSSPTSVTAGDPVTVTITNCQTGVGPCSADSVSNLGSASFTISGAALKNPAPFSVNATNGQQWDVTISGDTVILHAHASGGELQPGDSVSVDVNPTTAGSYTVATEAGSPIDNSGYEFNNASTDPQIAVVHGPLAKFEVGDVSAQTASQLFDVLATAEDQYGNAVTNYSGTPTISGLTASSSGCDSDNTTVDPSGGYPCDPVYGTFGTWTNGHSFAPVTAYAAGVGSLTVSDGAPTGNSNNFPIAPAGLDHFTVAGPGSTTAGDPLSVTVTAYDAFGNQETDYTGTIHFTSTDHGTSTALPADYTFTQSEAGTHTFTDGVTLTTAPSQTVSVNDTADTSKTGTSDSITVNPGPLASFSVVPSATTTTAGVPISVTVSALDAYGNVDSSGPNLYGGRVHFTTTDPGTQTVVPMDYTFTTTGGSPDDGVHTFTNGVTLTKTPSQTVSVNDTSDLTKTGVSSLITVDPGPLHHFAWTKEPSSPQLAGTSWGSDAAEVTAYDAYGNVDGSGPNLYTGGSAQFGGLGTSPASNAPSYGTVTWSAGVGTVNSVIDYDAESASLTITDGSVGPTASSAVTVNPAPLDHFSVVGPASTIAGNALSVTVTARDAYGNVDSSGPNLYGGTVHFTTTDPGAQTVLPANYTFTTSGAHPDNGVHTFTNGVTLTKTHSQTVSVNDASDVTKNGTSASITVYPAPLDHFVWTKQPSGTQTAGVSWGSDAAEVTAYDAYNNVDDTGPNLYAGTNASLSGLGNSPAPVSHAPSYGTLGWSAGVGTVSNVIDYKAETASLKITDSVAHVGPTASNAVTVYAGAPASVQYTQQPNEVEVFSGGTCATPGPPACFISHYTTAGGVQVLAKDTWGNVANNQTTMTTKIGIAKTTGPGSLFGGAAQNTDSNGLVTFTGLEIDTVNIGDVLTATATSTTSNSTPSVASNPFDVANQLVLCNHACNGNASQQNNQTDSVAVSGSGSADTLGLALAGDSDPGIAACQNNPANPGWAPSPAVGGGTISWTYTDITSTSGSLPSFQFTWELLKAAVNLSPDNGVAHYDICLGAVWIGTPATPVPVWTTKGGGKATGVAGFDQYGMPVTRYWGLVPDCNAKGLTKANPCVVSRSKDRVGDVFVVFNVPAGWDPQHNGGI